jgi:hypothetical protein
MKMKLEEFEEAVQKEDFAVGDSFWLDDWEFAVVNRSHGGTLVEDEVVFKWELTRAEFIHVLADNHPEIEDPEGFFNKHKDDIMHRFRKGFDILVGECGATYGTVMNDAIDEAVGKEQAKKSQSDTGITGGGEDEGNGDH